jgi:hypothetical protein
MLCKPIVSFPRHDSAPNADSNTPTLVSRSANGNALGVEPSIAEISTLHKT